MEVRSEYTNGKLLFEWNPKENIVSIVHKDMLYRVKLIQQTEDSKYCVLEKNKKEHLTRDKINYS